MIWYDMIWWYDDNMMKMIKKRILNKKNKRTLRRRSREKTPVLSHVAGSNPGILLEKHSGNFRTTFAKIIPFWNFFEQKSPTSCSWTVEFMKSLPSVRMCFQIISTVLRVHCAPSFGGCFFRDSGLWTHDQACTCFFLPIVFFARMPIGCTYLYIELWRFVIQFAIMVPFSKSHNWLGRSSLKCSASAWTEKVANISNMVNGAEEHWDPLREDSPGIRRGVNGQDENESKGEGEGEDEDADGDGDADAIEMEMEMRMEMELRRWSWKNGDGKMEMAMAMAKVKMKMRWRERRWDDKIWCEVRCEKNERWDVRRGKWHVRCEVRDAGCSVEWSGVMWCDVMWCDMMWRWWRRDEDEETTMMRMLDEEEAKEAEAAEVAEAFGS